MRTKLSLKTNSKLCLEDLDLDNGSEEPVEKLIEDHEEAHDDYEDDVEEFEDTASAIDDANEVKEELEEKVVALEALDPTEVNGYILNDAKATYFKACKKIGCEPANTLSPEDYDTNIQLSIEGIKEVIDAIVKAIKEAIEKIITFVKNLYIKFQVAFNNDEKVAKQLLIDIKQQVTKQPNGKTDFDARTFVDYLTGKSKAHEYYKQIAALMVIDEKMGGKTTFTQMLNSYVAYGKKFSHITFGNIKSGGNLIDFLEGYYLADSHSKSLVGYFDLDERNNLKNDAMLKDFIVTAVKGTKIYGFNIYEANATSTDDTEFSFNGNASYEVNTLKGKRGGENVTMFVNIIADISYTEVLNLANLVVSSTADIKAIKAQFDKMVVEAKHSADKLSEEIKKDPTMSKTELNNVKSMSVAFSRMYTDKMLSYLYLNKVMISILKDALAGMK